MIEIQHLTKDFGNHKGIFDVDFSIQRGETTGFIGANGAGKTTTIRHLMGFLHPDRGQALIDGENCFQNAEHIQSKIGYLPGEIRFMNAMSGQSFIEFMAQMKGVTDLKRANELIHYFELDTKVNIKKMSKGMKQKLGLVLAFMQDAPILILDEPTSGLDPLMQKKFVEWIQNVKKRGKTILMSSHLFEEIEHTCNHIVLIKEGKILVNTSMEEMQKKRNTYYEICFSSHKDALAFHQKYKKSNLQDHQVVLLWNQDIQTLLKELSNYKLNNLHVYDQSLEDFFLSYYQGEAI